MSNDISSVSSQDKLKKVKKGHKLIFLFILLLLVLVIVTVFILYLLVNTDEAFEHRGLEGLNYKIEEYFYKTKCQLQDRIYYEAGWFSSLCYKRSPDAGKECIQNSDCQAGVCTPSAIPTKSHIGLTYYDEWRGMPKVNEEGFITGTCSVAAYPFYPDYGGTCMSSYIREPSTLEDPSGISEAAFCN